MHPDANQSKNLLAACLLSILVLVGWDFFFGGKKNGPVGDSFQNKSVPLVDQQQRSDEPPHSLLNAPPPPPKPHAPEPRVVIMSKNVKGSIGLRGVCFDDLVLLGYTKTLRDASPVRLLEKEGKHAYYGFFGWFSQECDVPHQNTVWKADHTTLSPERPVTFQWQNSKGVVFQQIVSMEEAYLFRVVQRVQNTTSAPFSLYAHGHLLRKNDPKKGGTFLLHEGPLGVFDAKLQELSYDKIAQSLNKQSFYQSCNKGWVGFTDKYWLAAFVPENTKGPFSMQFFCHGAKEGGQEEKEPFLYEATFCEKPRVLDPNHTFESSHYFFVGPKEVGVLDSYGKKYHIPHFDLAVDFGWFYFLTKPIFHALDFFKKITGNFGLAILVLTVFLKTMFFPLSYKTHASMKRLKRFQPLMTSLKERYQNDKTKLQEETLKLYRREKINPLAGFLPMLIQVPVFFALYKVLFVTIEMRHAPFFGWIDDLSSPDPTNIFTLFGVVPWGAPSFLEMGLWPVLMGFSMFCQQKLNPSPPDPVQEKMLLYAMPVMFSFMLASFPVGLVIYWTWNNVLSVGQQALITNWENKKAALQPHKKNPL